jgi:hypothetical protein
MSGSILSHQSLLKSLYSYQLDHDIQLENEETVQVLKGLRYGARSDNISPDMHI